MNVKPRISGILPLALGICLAILAGCSEKPTDTSQAVIALQSELVNADVTGTIRKGASSSHAGDYADSVKVTRVRMLISRLNLYSEVSGEHRVKEGPVLVVVEPNSTGAVMTTPVPTGTYNNIDFDFYRFSESERSQYANDPLYADFVSDERSSLVIDGFVYVDSLALPFKYRFASDVTTNLDMAFDPVLTLDAGTTTKVSLVVDTDRLFRERQSTKIHDPRDSRNQSEIDLGIPDLVTALKR